MQRWEYCIVHSDTLRDIGSFATASPDGWEGKEIRADKSQGDLVHWDAAGRSIAQFGLDGWELVGVYTPSSGVTVLWFKRRIPEAE